MREASCLRNLPAPPRPCKPATFLRRHGPGAGMSREPHNPARAAGVQGAPLARAHTQPPPRQDPGIPRRGGGERLDGQTVRGRGLDVGAGKGRSLDATVTGGVVGLIIDGRGRPLPHSKDTAERVAALRQAYDSFGLPAE